MTTSIASSAPAGGVVPAASSTATPISGAAQSTQFETFLKMLTTQIKNQDPLNPMEGTEFAVQLATFSGVEQQVQTNMLLEKLLQEKGGGELGQLSDWIGREVRTSAAVWYDGKPVSLAIEAGDRADRPVLVTLDEHGREVLRQDIAPGTGTVDWLGKRANGEPLPAGLYSFHVESQLDGKPVKTGDVQAQTIVTGVELTADGARLVLSGGARATVRQITALGAAAGSQDP